MNPMNKMVPMFVICVLYSVKTGVKQYEQNIVYNIQIANIGIDWVHISNHCKEISSPIRYADCMTQLLCKLSAR
jgi:hypothetical protein